VRMVRGEDCLVLWTRYHNDLEHWPRYSVVNNRDQGMDLDAGIDASGELQDVFLRVPGTEWRAAYDDVLLEIGVEIPPPAHEAVSGRGGTT
jgi:hypothetical protein